MSNTSKGKASRLSSNWRFDQMSIYIFIRKIGNLFWPRLGKQIRIYRKAADSKKVLVRENMYIYLVILMILANLMILVNLVILVILLILVILVVIVSPWSSYFLSERSKCLKQTNYTFCRLNWCDSGWWRYQLNTNW